MDYLSNVQDVLESYSVLSGVYAIYGNWVISNKGDLVNIAHRYPIYSYELRIDAWFILNLRDKDWFDAEESIMFSIAHNKAVVLASLKGTDKFDNPVPTLDRLP